MNFIYPCLSFYRIEYFELGEFDALSSFVVNLVDFNLLMLRINFDFTVAIDIKANHSNFSIIVGDLLPFNGEGPAT